MKVTQLIESLDSKQLIDILTSDKEYLILDLMVFNAGSVLSIELVNDLPHEYEDNTHYYDRASIAEVITSLVDEAFYKFFIRVPSNFDYVHFLQDQAVSNINNIDNSNILAYALDNIDGIDVQEIIEQSY